MQNRALFIDAHTHLSSPELAPQASQLMEEAQRAGVVGVINVTTNPRELHHALDVQKEHPQLYIAAATTPHDAAEEGELYFEEIAAAAHAGKLVALGETGLDYFQYAHTAERQKTLLRRYLELASELSLPIVIHCRDAFADLLQIIDAHNERAAQPIKGMLHCFTGTPAEAAALIERGWYLSFSGIVTFPKSIALRNLAVLVPLSQLLIETDAPWLAPAPLRGKQNAPAYLVHTAHCIAQARGISLEELSQATLTNTETLFALPDSRISPKALLQKI